MEVVVAEEKKKIFRARKTMKASDRRQLESLHSTLLTAAAGSSDTSVPPLMNGTHKEDVEKVGDKEINNVSDSNSPNVSPPASPTSLSSPAPFLSLNLSPSSGSSQSPKAKDEPSPASPFYSLNFELNKMKEAEDRGGERESSSSVIDKSATLSTEVSANQEEVIAANPELEKEQAGPTATKDSAVELGKDSNKGLVQRLSTPTTDCTEPMDTDTNARAEKAPEAATNKTKERKSTKAVTSNFSQSFPSRVPSSCVDLKQEKETKDGDTDKGDNKKQDAKKTLMNESKTEPKSVKGGTKSQKTEVCPTTKPCRPSSTPPSEAVQKDKTAVPGLKRTLSEGNGDNEKDEANTKRDLKRPKMQNEELEAKLELKITAKAGAHPKLEKIVQKLVDEHLRALQLAFFDQPFKELKDRIDKIDCAAKHQTAVNTLQSKITRLAKKFGEANQELENKKKQEVAAATAPGKMAPGKTTPGKTAPGKTAPEAKSPQVQRPVRTPLEVKHSAVTVSPSVTSEPNVALAPSAPAHPGPVAVPVPAPAPAPGPAHAHAPAPAPAPAPVPVPVPTSTAMVIQAPVLQLITSTSSAVSPLPTALSSQNPTGTLLLKTAPGSNMMTAGQPLLIQLPLSVANGQTGTLVNIPVSSFSAASSLNKAKTTSTTTAFIIKPASAVTSAPISAPVNTTVSALQGSSSQMSVARAVFQGGSGGICTPSAGVSVSTARTPAQPVSVAGAMSSVSSPAASGPAATGSTAPGPPQGTSLTSKTDNQAAGSTASKGATPAARPKGSVIDLTEDDDDDVQVTGVKSASVTAASAVQRPLPVCITSSPGARSARQSSQNSPANSQLTAPQRPQLDSPLSPRTNIATTPSTRGPSVTLPPLPSLPIPPRLSPEAERTSPPQQPQLKLVSSQTGIVLSWCVAETDQTCAPVDSYHLYAFHQDNSSSNAAQQHWKKIGVLKALPLPMACTLTQFQSGSTYHFAVRAKDVHGRFGPFCKPQCTSVISSSSS